MADPTIRCPWCQFECKSWASLCASCGMNFKSWLDSNPGKSIPGWNPGARPAPPPTAPSLTPASDPAASGLISPSVRKGGGVLFVIAIFQIIAYAILSAIGGDDAQMAELALGCIVAAFMFGGLAAGAFFKGWRTCLWLGIGLIVLDTVITVASQPTMALRGIVIKTYFVYLLYKSATE